MRVGIDYETKAYLASLLLIADGPPVRHGCMSGLVTSKTSLLSQSRRHVTRIMDGMSRLYQRETRESIVRPQKDQGVPP